jgi:signal transduction histidine kinase
MATWTNNSPSAALPATGPHVSDAGVADQRTAGQEAAAGHDTGQHPTGDHDSTSDRRTWLGRVLRQLATDSAYTLLFGLPFAIMSFTILVVGVVLAAGLMITTLGLPILAGTLLAARGLGDLHRISLAGVVRRRSIRPQYAKPDAHGWRRLLPPIRDSQSWLDLIAGVVDLPLAIVGFVVSLTWWALALGGVSTILWDWSIPYPAGSGNYGPLRAFGLANTHAHRVLVYTIIGIFALLTLPIVVRLVALARAQTARALLCGVAEMHNQIVGLQQRNAGLTSQKRAAASAETTALRRIERDIHDGPQQRLVRTAMDLARAKQQLTTDPEAARRTIEEVLGQTRETLDELRALSRGIAPPVLTDRGLSGALAALAARSPIPVDLRLPADIGRLDPNTETTLYFVVAEALTNMAKHSHADIAAVRVDLLDDGEIVQVWAADNGAGGAGAAKGHGLAGLADRVRAAGGEFEVTSPVGGPTELRAVLPCG